ncbi:hypothetical protein EH165_08620 [Nakamurella antarctica]|uniref:Uncharacterized protein n=1 Tax=Nakamurella antarctica TaxID=1902245 RepID=A0A3G8ZX05_9ACTN|nr:hypothetical protein [Nakamurella antarctica]AZI58191.1 hypothetical protein EH165_08620 [Nakamurella antarctica]
MPRLSRAGLPPEKRRTTTLVIVLAGIVVAGVLGSVLVGGLLRESPVPPTSLRGSGTPATSPTGSIDVVVSEAAAQNANATQVQKLFATYFSAINGRDYERYVAAVSQPLAKAQFDTNYATSVDTDGMVRQIHTDEAGKLQVLVSFVSTQSVDSAPPELPVKCIAWTVEWGMDGEPGALLIGTPVQSSTQMEECS